MYGIQEIIYGKESCTYTTLKGFLSHFDYVKIVYISF